LTFSIKFSAKKVVFLVSGRYDKISSLLPPWKKLFGYPWKNPLFPPPWKKFGKKLK